MDIHIVGHGPQHEFEKPICLITENANVQFACGQVQKAGERFKLEIKETIDALMKRQGEISKALLIQLETVLKESGKWPRDWDAKKDHLMVNNGVIFQARCGE